MPDAESLAEGIFELARSDVGFDSHTRSRKHGFTVSACYRYYRDFTSQYSAEVGIGFWFRVIGFPKSLTRTSPHRVIGLGVRALNS